jgi:hypothetical protein
VNVTLHLEQAPSLINGIRLKGNEGSEIISELTHSDVDSIQKISAKFSKSMKALGCEKIDGSTLEMQTAYHFSGSLRMGICPSTSVLNLNGKVHGYPEVTVLGLAGLPSTGYTNPTYSALVLNRILIN